MKICSRITETRCFVYEVVFTKPFLLSRYSCILVWLPRYVVTRVALGHQERRSSTFWLATIHRFTLRRGGLPNQILGSQGRVSECWLPVFVRRPAAFHHQHFRRSFRRPKAPERAFRGTMLSICHELREATSSKVHCIDKIAVRADMKERSARQRNRRLRRRTTSRLPGFRADSINLRIGRLGCPLCFLLRDCKGQVLEA